MIKNDYKDVELPQEKFVGIYRGVVEDNNDLLQAGRVRVRIFGIHSPAKIKLRGPEPGEGMEGIPTDELPWAEPVLGLIEGSISKCGVFGVPLQGSHVFVFFEMGNILAPRYFGSVPGIPTSLPDTTMGFNDPEGEWPSLEHLFQPDWNTLGNSRTVYPNNIAFETHAGHEVEIDSTPGNERYRVYHPSGTEIRVDNLGNVDITIVSNETRNITINRSTVIGGNDTNTIIGDLSNYVMGDLTNSIQGDESETISGDSIEAVVGDKNMTSTNLIINATGNCNITAGGTVNINAPEIILGGGPQQSLLGSRAASQYNAHTHSGAVGTPSDHLLTSDYLTTNTTAS